MRRARSIYRDEHKGVSITQEDAWEILKTHAKLDAPELVCLTGDVEVPGKGPAELFDEDASPRPAGKQRAKIQNSKTTYEHRGK